MATPHERNRRFGLIAGVLVLAVLVVVFASLFGMCGESGYDDTTEIISPDEEVGPAPGVAP